MRNLLLLFSKYGTLILFLILEAISLTLIVRYNNRQNEIFLYSSGLLTANVLKKYDGVVNYLSLKEKNDSIRNQNAQVLAKLYNAEYSHSGPDVPIDSMLQVYSIIPATICNKTINVRNNRMTLDKGLEKGIDKGMGVLSQNGIVGIVKQVNNKFASVIPIINTQLRISAKIKNKNYFGDLIWEPYDERVITLQNIPKHASVAIGDTVITSGYSTVFPPNIDIGKIKEITLPRGSNYFNIKVKLNNSFSKLENVYVIDYKFKKEKIQLEAEF